MEDKIYSAIGLQQALNIAIGNNLAFQMTHTWI